MPRQNPEELLGFCRKTTNTCGIQQSGLLKLQCWNGKKDHSRFLYGNHPLLNNVNLSCFQDKKGQ